LQPGQFELTGGMEVSSKAGAAPTLLRPIEAHAIFVGELGFAQRQVTLFMQQVKLPVDFLCKKSTV
jgi:hypothetical protein